MFKLNKKEKLELVTNCDRFASLKHSSVAPGAFTDQGVAMFTPLNFQTLNISPLLWDNAYLTGVLQYPEQRSSHSA
jgi:hypothetical protein